MALKDFFSRIGSERVMVTFHSIADLDAVAAALALKLYLEDAHMVAPDHVNAEANKLLHFMNQKLLYLKDIAPSDYKYKILVDTNSKAMVPGAENLGFDCIIDHHSRHEDSFDAKEFLIDNTASSTCELIYPLFSVIEPDVALCLLCGIISDSARFRNVSTQTFYIVSELLPKCSLSYQEILSLIEVHPDVSERLAVLNACSSARITRKDDMIIATSISNSFESHSASALISFGADFAFVGHKGKGNARISGRMRAEYANKVDLPKIMGQAARLVKGTGGGHPYAAGATGTDPSGMENALAKCEELVLAPFSAPKPAKK